MGLKLILKSPPILEVPPHDIQECLWGEVSPGGPEISCFLRDTFPYKQMLSHGGRQGTIRQPRGLPWEPSIGGPGQAHEGSSVEAFLMAF